MDLDARLRELHEEPDRQQKADQAAAAEKGRLERERLRRLDLLALEFVAKVTARDMPPQKFNTALFETTRGWQVVETKQLSGRTARDRWAIWDYGRAIDTGGRWLQFQRGYWKPAYPRAPLNRPRYPSTFDDRLESKTSDDLVVEMIKLRLHKR
jgi:hypothetical protein